MPNRIFVKTWGTFVLHVFVLLNRNSKQIESEMVYTGSHSLTKINCVRVLWVSLGLQVLPQALDLTSVCLCLPSNRSSFLQNELSMILEEGHLCD